MVKVAPVTVRPGALVVPETLTASPAPSSMSSWAGSMAKVWVPVLDPAEMVRVTSSTAA